MRGMALSILMVLLASVQFNGRMALMHPVEKRP